MSKVTLTAQDVEWTNPLTGDGERCEVVFDFDTEDDEVKLFSVTWNRTSESCAMHYISNDVKDELIQGIRQQIGEGDFDEELQIGDYAPEGGAGASD